MWGKQSGGTGDPGMETWEQQSEGTGDQGVEEEWDSDCEHEWQLCWHWTEAAHVVGVTEMEEESLELLNLDVVVVV